MSTRNPATNLRYAELILAVALAACQSVVAPGATDPTTAVPIRATVSVAAPVATACLANLVLPQITEVQPATAAPGASLKVIGSGGYIQDTCAVIDESARTFPLYFDRRSISALGCYVDHCEGEVTIPPDAPPGPHCLSVEPGKCTFELQVVNH
jgi:hypothetical protein